MIIRYSVGDNDYTDKIKNFYKDIKFNSDAWFKSKDIDYSDTDQLKKAVEMQSLYETLLEKNIYYNEILSSNELKTFTKLLEVKFDYFLEKIGEEKLIDQRTIDVVSMVTDKNCNGEYVYYFVESDQIIIL